MAEYFESHDVEENRLFAVLCYLGVLLIIPIIVRPNSKFVKFHANQGVLLLITSFVYGIANRLLGFIIGWIPFLGGIILTVFSLIGLFIFILMILGIVNAVQGKGKELPIIGSYRLIK